MDAWIPPINGSREGFLLFVSFTGSQSNFRGALCREKIPSKHDKQPAKQRCLGFFGRFHASSRKQRESCAFPLQWAHTRLTFLHPPDAPRVLFPHSPGTGGGWNWRTSFPQAHGRTLSEKKFPNKLLAWQRVEEGEKNSCCWSQT